MPKRKVDEASTPEKRRSERIATKEANASEVVATAPSKMSKKSAKNNKGKQKTVNKKKEPIKQNNLSDIPEATLLEEGDIDEGESSKGTAAHRRLEAFCVYRFANYTIKGHRFCGAIGKKLFYRAIVLTPKLEEFEAAKIREGDQVQVYPNDEWLTVVLIHIVNSKFQLHLCNSPSVNANAEVISLDKITATRRGTAYNSATSADRYAVDLVAYNAKLEKAVHTLSKPNSNSSMGEMGRRKMDKDLLAGVNAKLNVLTSEVAAMKHQILELKADFKDVYTRVVDTYTNKFEELHKGHMNAMIAQAEAIRGHK